ncbi:hypothetical protein, partial [Metabacillus sp. RGM 3146]|uniref:hypothetical protein n=1 Tax=Metabacillus sp. RGM 3146 TaxID=3401092 RepID=UPI003B9987FA
HLITIHLIIFRQHFNHLTSYFFHYTKKTANILLKIEEFVDSLDLSVKQTDFFSFSKNAVFAKTIRMGSELA